MTSASDTQRRSSGRTGAGLAFDLSVRIRRPAPEVFALLADIQGCVLHHRETLRPSNRGPGGALLAWLPAVIAPPLRRHVAERLDDIRAYVESGA